jgi:hypothetical protein
MHLFLNALNKAIVNQLHIPPISEFQHNSPVFGCKSICKIVIGIYQIQIGSRAITPLEAGVDIKVVGLIIVLHEVREKYFVRQRNIQPWS